MGPVTLGELFGKPNRKQQELKQLIEKKPGGAGGTIPEAGMLLVKIGDNQIELREYKTSWFSASVSNRGCSSLLKRRQTARALCFCCIAIIFRFNN